MATWSHYLSECMLQFSILLYDFFFKFTSGDLKNDFNGLENVMDSV